MAKKVTKATKAVATPKATNAKAVVVVEAAQVELYEIPQSLPVQERSRNAVRRGLFNYLKANDFING